MLSPCFKYQPSKRFDRSMSGIREIAREVGVSISTVSYALNGTRPISDGTKKRIQDAVKRLGYRPDARGRSLGAMRSRVVGVVIPSLTTYFIAPLLAAIDEALFNRGYRLLIAHAERQKKTEQLFDNGQVDGIIGVISSVLGNDEGEAWADGLNIHQQPQVVVNRFIPGRAGVRTDYRVGAFLATSHLLKLGHKRIGFVGEATTDPTQVELLLGYQDALKQHGVCLQDHWIAPNSKAAFEQWHDLPTAAFVAGQYHTFPFYREARNLSIRIPEDMAVVGFDDDTNEADLYPSLTTIAQHHERVAENVVDLVIKGMEGYEIEDKQILIEPTLILRESCGRGKLQSRKVSC